MFTKDEIQTFIDIFHSCTIPEDVCFHLDILLNNLNRLKDIEKIMISLCFSDRIDNTKIMEPKYPDYNEHYMSSYSRYIKPLLGYNIEGYDSNWETKMNSIDWKYDTLKNMILNDSNLRYSKI